MLKKTSVFLIFLLNLLHCINCDEFEENREQWMAYLSQGTGSCSRYFQYLRTDNFINGKLTLPHMKIGDTVNMTFYQHNSSECPKSDGIFLPEGSPQEVINRLKNYQQISYRVDFPITSSPPELLKIFINDNVLCETGFEKSSDNILLLQHTLNIINESLPVFAYNIRMPHIVERQNEPCGIVDTQIAFNGVTPLAYGGTSIIRGEYPWLAAIYKKHTTDLNFICGGSLVTSKMILSAAHCFLGLSWTPEKITAMLGRYNLTNSLEDGFVQREIENIILHPDFRYVLGFSDADLALLEMKEHVSFTKFIKPICLWSESADESRIVNQIGVAVGWGSDEDGNTISAVPKEVNSKIVSENECLRSSPAFNAITSSRTLCAGYRNGSGPCEGDSGGGLVLNRNGVWVLRGVISLALTAQQRCDLQKYAVYCDVAKHTPWLQNYITYEYDLNTPQFAEEPNEYCGLLDKGIVVDDIFRSPLEERGEYPWLTTIYKKHIITGLWFTCGGSLVTSKIILTAGQCFVDQNLTAENFVTIFGRYDRDNFLENDFVLRKIETIILHPDYKNDLSFFDADLALLEMKEHVSFTKFIKPICLWSETADGSQITNQTAVVIALDSKFDGNRISVTPNKVNVKIASKNECLRASPALSAITSSRSLCAGSRDGYEPCVKGAGTGLVIKRNGVWMIRGVLSARSTAPLRCDSQDYAVYCDVAKHLSWLQNYIKQQQPPLTRSVDDICGRSATESRFEHPWLAAIYRKELTGVLYECTGSLISSRNVLAPANCFLISNIFQLPPHFIRIYLGHYDLNNIAENGVVSRDVATLMFHPDFKPSTSLFQNNNIALLQMKDPVSFTQYVKPICLWRESMIQSEILGQSVTLSSWNKYEVRNESLTVRASIEVKVASPEECPLLGDDVVNKALCVTHFGNKTEGIIMLKQKGLWLVRGMSSRCYADKSENFCLYTDTAEHLSWIQSNM